jgi:adenosylcobinamide-phosphate synthase
MMLVLTIAAALLLDLLLGEPKRFHPLVGFGRLAQIVERRVYGAKRFRGIAAVVILIAPFTLLALLVSLLPFRSAIEAVLLYLALGWRSLGEHAHSVRDALLIGDMAQARKRVSMIVSRDTDSMNASDVSKATVESVLENGNDAVFGAIFWLAVAGAPGIVAYRLANTLDAMWGYRNDRYRNFGWAAARLDDVLNYLPARLTALSYAIAGNRRSALFCWRTQGGSWKSPNAGPVMAAGAGSLALALGGTAVYQGNTTVRPPLGVGNAPIAKDIDRALALLHRSIWVWLAALSGGVLLVELAR